MDEKGITQLLKPLTTMEQSVAPSSPKRLYLVVLSGGVPGTMLPLAQGLNGIGRSAENTIQLIEAGVSRQHATLSVGSDLSVELTDLGSTNGTLLNHQRLEPHQPVQVQDGDRIRFGSTLIMKFLRPDAEEERFQREMFERTVRDSLTGLFNRSYFLSQVGPLIQRSAARGLGLGILMLDIDRFKRFNDTHGHAAGDTVLQGAARVLMRTTRPQDLIARHGGEEFIIALPAPSVAQTMASGERIRATLASRRIRLESLPVQVTASIGVAFSSADHPRQADALISEADIHLYRAKQEGRNRVIGPFSDCAPPLEPQDTFECVVRSLAPISAISTRRSDNDTSHSLPRF